MGTSELEKGVVKLRDVTSRYSKMFQYLDHEQNVLSWKNVINFVTQGRSRGRKGGLGGHCDGKTDSQPRS